MFQSFAAFFTYTQIVLLSSAATFVTGVVFADKVKDWVKGIPVEVRKAVKNVEAEVLSRVKAAQSDILAQLPQPPAPKVALKPADQPIVHAEPVKAAIEPAPTVAEVASAAPVATVEVVSAPAPVAPVAPVA